MAVDDGNFDDINMDLQDLNLGDLVVLPTFHEFPESQLCVPPDPIEDLEWFPSFSDDFISLKEIVSSPNHHQPPPDDQNLIEYRNFPATPEQHEHHEKKDWVGISGLELLGGFTKKKARTKKKCSGKCLENNQKAKRVNWERNLKRCSHCETEETPQWRVGPMGPKTLCNACGVRFKSGRLLAEYRPAASPTFDASRHSNYHKKILKRRGFVSYN